MNLKDLMKHFSNDDIRKLIEIERKMDSGEVPHVMMNGQRFAMEDELMTEFGLKSGQTVNELIMARLLEFKIAHAKTKIETKKLMDNNKPHATGSLT